MLRTWSRGSLGRVCMVIRWADGFNRSSCHGRIRREILSFAKGYAEFF
jgi:hypothetical protein